MLSRIINSIKLFIHSLVTLKDLKSDTEKILALIKEYEACSNIKEFKSLKRQFEKERNLRSSILDHLDDMVWCKDLDGKYLMTNKSFRDKFCYGFNDANILGKTDVELAKEFKEKVGNENHTYGELCKNSDLVVQDVQDSLQFLESGKINGTIMKLVVNKSPIRDYKGRIFGVVGSGRDVTEWHNSLESAIKSSNACFGDETRTLLLKELNRLEFK